MTDTPVSKAEQIAKQHTLRIAGGYAEAAALAAVNEAMEWAAQQCERQDHPDYVDGSWYARDIRAGKSVSK